MAEASQTGQLADRWTVVDGLRIYMRVGAEPVPAGRPTIVLVHGLSVSSRYMVPTAEHLAPLYPVYAPDFPGFGRSDNPPRVLDIPELANVLRKWMDTVGLDHPTLLANSLGCQVAVDFAMRYPQRVDRLILNAPTMDPRARTLRQQFARLALDSVREPLSQPFIVLGDYFRTGTRRTFCTLRYALADMIEAKLPRVRAETLIVRGAHDPIVPQAWAEESARLLPRGRLVVVPGAAHTVNYSSPAELVRIVRSFLNC